MNSSTKLIEKFQKELKHRISIKIKKKITPEKMLLNAFKYYDIQNHGLADYKIFSQVIMVKLGINIFSDEQLTLVFDHYLNTLESAKNQIFYRDLVSYLFNVNVNLQTPNPDDRSVFTETKSFTRNKNDILDETETVKKMIEYMIYKLEKQSLTSFLKLYKDMISQDKGDQGFLSFDSLNSCIKNAGVDIQEENIEKIWVFFQNKMGQMQYEKMWDLICLNFNQNRINACRAMFDKLDTNRTKFVSFNLLEELFYPRNHVWVKQGRKTLEEVQNEFFEYVKMYQNILGVDLMSVQQLVSFFKYISPFFKMDKDFLDLLDNGFRYNELRNLQNFQQKSAQSKLNYGRNDYSRNEINSVRTNLQPHNVMLIVEEQLSKKGSLSYINFYKSLKGNDYDRDNYLYLKEWIKVLQEQRVQMNDAQQKSLFQNFSMDQYKMNYEKLMEKMIPQFDAHKKMIVKDLYDSLLKEDGKSELSFYRVSNSFLPRQHPDFKEGRRQDYEIKNEFLQGLQTFLVNFQGNHVQMDLYTFERFFEFYARDWNEERFELILLCSFNTKKRKQMFQNTNDSTPFGTDLNRQQQSQYDQQNRFYQEFKSKKTNYQVSTPFYTDDQQKAFKKKQEVYDQNDLTDNYEQMLKEKQIQKNRMQEMDHRIQRNDQQEQVSHIRSRRSRLSNRSNTKKSHHTNDLNSPEDGSILSHKQDKYSVYQLNKQIQDNLQDQSMRVYDNVNNRQLGQSTPFAKFIKSMKDSKKMTSILELEYEMTNKSDQKGNVSWQNFYSVLNKLKLLGGLYEEQLKEIYQNNLNDEKKLHVQTFANDLRDQMSEERENIVIELFDKLCNKTKQEIISVEDFRKSFIPEKFIYSLDGKVVDRMEMMNYMIDLFVCLNLQVKNRNYFDLDDFLYIFDNFSFFIENDKEFQFMTKTCFK